MAGILGLLGLGGSQPAAAGMKPTDDWFAQFNPANKSPNGGINPNPGQVIPIQPSQDELNQQGQYAPSATPGQPSYADFQRDYWAPDREQVLAGMTPPMATNKTPMPSISAGNDGMIRPTGPEWRWSPSNPGRYGSHDTSIKWPELGGQNSVGGTPIGNPGSLGAFGGLGLAGLIGGQSPKGSAQTLIKMRTPHGTVAHVPTSQIEEALRRGATQV